MKTNDLRTTVLILGGTLLAASVLGGWHVSQQARALREIRTEAAARTEELALLRIQVAGEQQKAEHFRASMATLNRRVIAEPASNVGGVLLRAKRGFNDIQNHVAKGEFPGLALTDGYMELKAMFDNPELEGLFEGHHAGAP
jgi:hypothetical protein